MGMHPGTNGWGPHGTLVDTKTGVPSDNTPDQLLYATSHGHVPGTNGWGPHGTSVDTKTGVPRG